MKESDDESLRIHACLGDIDARHTLGASRLTRFDGLAAFVERWFDHPLHNSVLSKSEMDACATKLAHPIPSALREWCRLVGTRPDEQVAQNALCTAQALPVCERDYGLAVYCENQSNWEYFIRREDYEQDDPTVWLYAGRQPLPTSCRLSACLFSGVLDETILLSEYCDCGPFGSFRGPGPPRRRYIEDREIPRLLAQFAPLIPPFSPWRPDIAEFHGTAPWEVRFHGHEDVVIAVEGPIGAAKTVVALVRTD